ncbi:MULTISPECIES: D-arabinono-1,4-lactone oxidase [unclassified Thalassolituus]|uniref:D-arabinono-1,4-lactone oxidase n=1 Tax=unclassified Thalassolituus TaxID=2624967 RepID=UPI0025EB98D0|nr:MULTISPECIES: D-arabinono-1,4-lactone oxidase [unclassified Thalassolituus]
MNFDRIKLNRRELLKASGAALIAAGTAGTTACSSNVKTEETPGIIGPDGKRVLPWSNWSGNQHCQPAQRLVPKNEDELAGILKTARQPIRCVGSGHSFSGLVPTDQTLLSLARLRGVENADLNTMEADVWAGTRLSQLGDKLWDQGMSVINMSDIDTQAFGGALATSTHGTGKDLGTISTQVKSLRIANSSGDILHCSATQNADLFNAARNNIGALGVVTQARIGTEKAYYLKEHSWMMSEEEGLERAAELRDAHRHYEMYALPHGDYMLGIAIDKIDPADIPEKPPVESGDAYEAFRTLANVVDYLPFLRGWLVNFGASGVEPETRYGPSHEIFGNLRDIRFNEMEYTVPAEVGPQCLREILHTIKKQNIPVVFPIEARYIKGDDVWLSPFYQRDGFSISCHNFHDKDYKKYFAAIEPIFWKYDGRPHWGKIHTLAAKEFAARYERFNDFLRIRAEMDPQGLFLNDHIRKVLGIV